LNCSLGLAPTRLDSTLGVVKAYLTRVGSGPFPTELFDADGEHMAKVGYVVQRHFVVVFSVVVLLFCCCLCS
jgi:adenylosuccinate synthase